MYTWEIVREETFIPRTSYIQIIFDISRRYGHNYDTVISAVLIGDKFINLSKKCYSIELAHVVTILSCKLNEDSGYDSLSEAITTLDNSILISMEQDIWSSLQYQLPRSHIMSDIHEFFCGFEDYQFSFIFWEICYQICEESHMLQLNSLVIIMAIIYLGKIDKLKASKTGRLKYFHMLIETIAQYTDCSCLDVLNAITNKD